jgi:hypothetical protein
MAKSIEQRRRISTIRKRYGEDAFVRYGKKGGSPILRAFAKGRLRYV